MLSLISNPDFASQMLTERGSATRSKSLRLQALTKCDWDFRDANTTYLTHALHPYPAKFIPQIPHRLIEELSAPGEIVADIFCGSGTTLLESMLLGRNALGLDANPLACLISEAKTVRLSASDYDALAALESRLKALILSLGNDSQGSLFEREGVFPEPRIPDDEAISFWFDSNVTRELGIINSIIRNLPERAELLANACFSSIIVAVSKQDSDTRYVRRDKRIAPGETLRRFLRALHDATASALDFVQRVSPNLSRRVIQADVLSKPNIGTVDLIVTSPPYPNAYSYHLYHKTRMLWLGMDVRKFKEREIGSHRKYSSRAPSGATRATFLSELRTIFTWLHKHLKPLGYACFVIGDSIIRGEVVKNDELIIEAAEASGFRLGANMTRKLQDTRKAFNPKIGKIKQEQIVILQRSK